MTQWIELNDNIKIACADCLDVIPIACEAVVTDPPYGNGTKYASTEDTSDQLAILLGLVMPRLIESAERVLVVCGVKNMWLYPKPTWVLNWMDPAGQGVGPWGFTSWNPILAYGPDPFLQDRKGSRSDSICKRFLRERDIPHPCPKPVGVMIWLLNRATRNNDCICDPFMGSGTTGIACIRTGRKFIGIEKDPHYFSVALKRLERELSQPQLFY